MITYVHGKLQAMCEITLAIACYNIQILIILALLCK